MIRVGILGTGNIGTDLLLKILKEEKIKPVIFAGRRMESDGIQLAKSKNVDVTDRGIDFFTENKNYVDVVFDCTNSIDAIEHAEIFREQNIRVIDLTPAKVGELCVPSINSNLILTSRNINMITCGGQAAMPILHLISKYCSKLKYVEIVSQIASKSAGLATRINVDGYIHTTEAAIKKFTKCEDCKVIINLNPAEPCVDMQTTMFIKFEDIDFESLVEAIYTKIKELRQYIPYYELVLPPVINEEGILVLSVRVRGSGDYLPEYAGNLDIINCAALEVIKKLM
jgi:acetaldehyde dehydrogenase (acetylating)